MPKLNWKLILFLVFFFTVIIGMSYFIYLTIFAPAPKPAEEQPIAQVQPTKKIPSLLPSAEERKLIELAPPPEQPLPTPAPGTKNIIPSPKPLTKISEIAKGGITKVIPLTDFPQDMYTLSFDGENINYYDRLDGYFYQLTPDGVVESISQKAFPFAKSVIWDRNKSQTILEFPDGSNILYDIKNDKQVTLPAHWTEFDFAPNTNQIAFKSLGLGDDQRWLAISNPDGTKIQLIEHIGYYDGTITVDWSPNNQIIAYQKEGYDQMFQELFFIGMHDENFKSLKVEGYGFEGKWSPKGDKMLYSAHNINTGYRPLLWIVNAQGDQIGSNKRFLRVSTWASKCTFSNNNIDIYCAVPDKLEEGVGLVPTLADEEKYTFYKINTRNGRREKIAIPDDGSPVEKVLLSKDEKYLYFTDANTGQIKRIKLKQ